MAARSDMPAPAPESSHIPARRAAWLRGMGQAKGYRADWVDGLGFVVDAIIAEMAARGEAETAEFQAVLDMRDAIKAAHPKPAP